MDLHLRLVARRALFWVLTFALAAAATIVSLRSALTEPVLGNRTTAAIIGSVQLLGPVALGAGAAAAVTLRRQGVGEMHRLSPRGARARAWCVTAVVTPFAIGYLIGALATGAWTTLQGSFGPIDWVGVVTGVLATAIHAVAGFLVGAWLPYRLTPGVAAITVYLVEVYTVDLYGTQVYLLQPLLVQLVTAFWGFKSQLFIRQLIWFVALLAFLLALATRLSRTRLLALGIVAVLAAIPLWQLHGQALAPGVTSFRYTCANTATGRTTVCVHPAYVAALPKLTTRFEALNQRLGPGTREITELDQVPRDGTQPRAGATAFSLDRITTTDMDNAVADVVQELINPAQCPDDYATQRMTAVVGDWVAGNTTPLPDLGIDPNVTPEVYAATTTFRGWADPRKSSWLASHWDAFTTCRITPGLVTRQP